MNKHDRLLFYYLSAFLFGCNLFLVGFFPVDFRKGDLPPSPEPPSSIDEISLKRPPKHVSQAVLMIVDALRYDFVTNHQMPYSSQYCNVKLKVNIPTVTMPRIKSLTSGTISNFIDVIQNLGSSQPIQDSILHKLHRRGDKIAFYGDITWVELFSKVFTRYESNTDSFYLREFHEADNNITRGLRRELKDLSNWEFLILHYIGLDRIGHMQGSDVEKISSKLREMDDVVKEINNALSEKISENKPLLLVTSDHGMRIGGGHGGSSPEELYVPLVIAGRNCSRQDRGTLQYDQVDIAATLAILLDVPIPSTSIGSIIPELLDGMSDESKLYALYYNTKFLIDKAIEKFGQNNDDYHIWYRTATESHKQYLTTLANEKTASAYLFEQAKLNYIRSAKMISELFAHSYTRFNFGMIMLGVVLTSLSTVFVVLTCTTNSYSWRKIPEPLVYLGRIFLSAATLTIVGHVFDIFLTGGIIFKCLVIISLSLIIHLSVELLKLLAIGRIHLTLDIPVSLSFGLLFQTFSMASTSFIEEEHQTWYYLGMTFLISLIWKNISSTRLKVIAFSSSSMERDILIFFSVLRPLKRAFIAMAITVFVRRLNQTGDKWMRVPDVGDWFTTSDNKVFLSVFLATSLALLCWELAAFHTPLQTVACIIACVSIYFYRGVIDAVVFFHADSFNPFLVLPFYWTSVIYILASSYLPVLFGGAKASETGSLCKLLGTNLTVFALISALLHKPHNVILVYAMHFILRCFYRLCDNLRGPRRTSAAQIILVYKVAVTICVSKMFYFYQGNSNSLATIDLNPGFVGLTHYNPLLVGLMVTANTYFAEIFGFLHLLLNINEKPNEFSITNELGHDPSEKNSYNLVTSLMASMKLLTTSVYLLLMIAFRHHLFIFTVFSPKVLYECFAIFLFYINYSMTNLYLSVLNKNFLKC